MDGFPQAGNGSRGGRARQRLELGERHLDRTAMASPHGCKAGAGGGTRTRTLIEKQIFLPLRLSPPPISVRGLDYPFAMVVKPKAPPV